MLALIADIMSELWPDYECHVGGTMCLWFSVIFWYTVFQLAGPRLELSETPPEHLQNIKQVGHVQGHVDVGRLLQLAFRLGELKFWVATDVAMRHTHNAPSCPPDRVLYDSSLVLERFGNTWQKTDKGWSFQEIQDQLVATQAQLQSTEARLQNTQEQLETALGQVAGAYQRGVKDGRDNLVHSESQSRAHIPRPLQ